MTRNGQRCHIVGVHRAASGKIEHVAVEALQPVTGSALGSITTGVDPHDLATENTKAEVFEQIAALEGFPQ